MGDWREFWRWGWTSCPGCGSFAIRPSLLCRPCEDFLLGKARAAFAIEGHLGTRGLFHWNPGESDLLSNLLLALKGPGASKAWDFWSDIFLQVHGRAIGTMDEIALVAAPARSHRRDHSILFAEGLSERLGCENLGRVLLKDRSFHLRGLSRVEREGQKPFVKVTGWSAPAHRKFVFVDDIITTGATARAVQQELMFPEGFEAWALALRTRQSCGASSPMLGQSLF